MSARGRRARARPTQTVRKDRDLSRKARAPPARRRSRALKKLRRPRISMADYRPVGRALPVPAQFFLGSATPLRFLRLSPGPPSRWKVPRIIAPGPRQGGVSFEAGLCARGPRLVCEPAPPPSQKARAGADGSRDPPAFVTCREMWRIKLFCQLDQRSAGALLCRARSRMKVHQSQAAIRTTLLSDITALNCKGDRPAGTG